MKWIIFYLAFFSFNLGASYLSDNECAIESENFLESMILELETINCMDDNLQTFVNGISKADNNWEIRKKFEEVVRALYGPELRNVCSHFGEQKTSCEIFLKEHKLSILAQIHHETLFTSNPAKGNNFFNIRSDSYRLRKPNDFFQKMTNGNIPHRDDGVATNFQKFKDPMSGLKGYLFFIFSKFESNGKVSSYGDCIKSNLTAYQLFSCVGEKGFATSSIQPSGLSDYKDAPIYKKGGTKRTLRIREDKLHELPKGTKFTPVGSDGMYVDIDWTGDVKNAYGFKMDEISKRYKNVNISAYANCLLGNNSSVNQAKEASANSKTTPSPQGTKRKVEFELKKYCRLICNGVQKSSLTRPECLESEGACNTCFETTNCP